MKTYQQFQQLDERAFSPAGQAARAKMRQQNELNRQKKKGGALVKTEKPGALTTRPADKGASIVRSKNYKQPMASRPDEKQVGKKPGSTRVSPGMEKVIKKGVKDDRKMLGKTAKGLAGKAINALRSKPPTEIEKASPLSLTPGGVNSKYSK